MSRSLNNGNWANWIEHKESVVPTLPQASETLAKPLPYIAGATALSVKPDCLSFQVFTTLEEPPQQNQALGAMIRALKTKFHDVRFSLSNNPHEFIFLVYPKEDLSPREKTGTLLQIVAAVNHMGKNQSFASAFAEVSQNTKGLNKIKSVRLHTMGGHSNGVPVGVEATIDPNCLPLASRPEERRQVMQRIGDAIKVSLANDGLVSISTVPDMSGTFPTILVSFPPQSDSPGWALRILNSLETSIAAAKSESLSREFFSKAKTVNMRRMFPYPMPDKGRSVVCITYRQRYTNMRTVLWARVIMTS